MKKGKIFAGFFILFSLVFLISHAYSAGDISTVGLVILPSSLQLFIHTPENDTINVVNTGCNDNILIELNASTNFDAESWWYTIENLRNGQVQTDVLSNASLTTIETNISVFRWDNRLTVFANDSTGFSANKSVVFYVNTSNHAPMLGSLEGEKFVCEASNLNYEVNATDCDADNLNFAIQGGSGLFFLEDFLTINTPIDEGNLAENSIFSTLLNKNHTGSYTVNVSVGDGTLSDSNKTNITVVEINNPPQYTVFIPGANTVWTHGENNTFTMKFNTSDVEDGNQDGGNLSYNISFSGMTLFGITNNGNVNYLGNVAHLGNHNVTVCVTDKGIPILRRHPQLQSICGQDGDNQTTCVTIQVTVTNENRPPTIVSFNPRNLTFPSFSTDNLYFNMTTFDPDGTLADAFWYVDEKLIEHDSLSSFNQFNYNFGCGVGGQHRIRADVSDGELNDSLQWNVTLINVNCPTSGTGGGGGGGGGGGSGFACSPKWACFDWNVCQNGARSLEIGTLSGEDYRIIKDGCVEDKLNTDTCGFQLRNCFDVNNCNSTRSEPSEIQSCLFTINPSCNDEIKNCHDGLCEFLVDCGGPCGACATCTDGVQNQGEENIDCGGPCPFVCTAEIGQRVTFKHYFVIFLAALVIITVILVWRVMKLRKKLQQGSQ